MNLTESAIHNYSSFLGDSRPSDYHNASLFEFSTEPEIPIIRVTSLLICVFFTVFVIPIGIIHNYLIYLTANSMPVQTSTTILFSYLAIVDIFCLLERLVFTMSIRIFIILFNINVWNNYNCKFFGTITFCTTFMSAFTTLGVSIDRALSIKFSNWHQKLNQKMTAIVIVAICLGSTFLTSIHRDGQIKFTKYSNTFAEQI